MARAILHTGQAVDFPDETPDHEIHAAVRAQMGLPPPQQGPAQAFAALSQHLIEAVQALQQSAYAVADAVQRFEAASQMSAHAAEAGMQSIDDLVSEMRRPKRAVKDKDGSWRTEGAGV